MNAAYGLLRGSYRPPHSSHMWNEGPNARNGIGVLLAAISTIAGEVVLSLDQAHRHLIEAHVAAHPPPSDRWNRLLDQFMIKASQPDVVINVSEDYATVNELGQRLTRRLLIAVAAFLSAEASDLDAAIYLLPAGPEAEAVAEALSAAARRAGRVADEFLYRVEGETWRELLIFDNDVSSATAVSTEEHPVSPAPRAPATPPGGSRRPPIGVGLLGLWPKRTLVGAMAASAELEGPPVIGPRGQLLTHAQAAQRIEELGQEIEHETRLGSLRHRRTMKVSRTIIGLLVCAVDFPVMMLLTAAVFGLDWSAPTLLPFVTSALAAAVVVGGVAASVHHTGRHLRRYKDYHRHLQVLAMTNRAKVRLLGCGVLIASTSACTFIGIWTQGQLRGVEGLRLLLLAAALGAVMLVSLWMVSWAAFRDGSAQCEDLALLTRSTFECPAHRRKPPTALHKGRDQAELEFGLDGQAPEVQVAPAERIFPAGLIDPARSPAESTDDVSEPADRPHGRWTAGLRLAGVGILIPVVLVGIISIYLKATQGLFSTQPSPKVDSAATLSASEAANPANTAPPVAGVEPVATVRVVSSAAFEPGSAQLQPGAAATLRSRADALAGLLADKRAPLLNSQSRAVRVNIVGCNDSRDPADSLSQARADEVAAILRQAFPPTQGTTITVERPAHVEGLAANAAMSGCVAEIAQ